MRANIRASWKKLATPSTLVIFIIGVNTTAATDETGADAETNAPIHQSLLEEARTKKDILFVPTVQPHPFSLVEKTIQLMKYVGACPSVTRVLKTNDHSFVRVDLLPGRLGEDQLPASGLVLGLIMKRQKVGAREKENHHDLTHWPDYPSGSGYVVSADVATFLAGTDLLNLPRYEFEDRALGLLLRGLAHLPTSEGQKGEEEGRRNFAGINMVSLFPFRLHRFLRTITLPCAWCLRCACGVMWFNV